MKNDTNILRRLLSLWEKASDEEKMQFKRYINTGVEPDMPDRIIGCGTAAKILGVTFYKARQLADAGEIPYVERTTASSWEFQKTHGVYRFRESDVLKFKRSR
jgi:hypothetical protein